MTNEQWELLLETVKGKMPDNPVTGFLVDSPWIPGWAGFSTLRYYSSEEIWFQANKKVVYAFPDIVFMPGFWAEYGMCTEPSAFGSRLIWNEFNLPHAGKVLNDISQAGTLKIPNPKTDGMLPFVIQRLSDCHKYILAEGHELKFAVSRGPLNIASYLTGTTELMLGFMMHPENSHKLLEIVTQFCINWIQYQREMFPSIEGILLLDDIVGFIGEEECKELAVPYIKRIFHAIDSKINFFHNDAKGLISSPYLQEMGVDLFNFSFEHSLKEIRQLAGREVALMGNLPARDVLAAGNPKEIKEKTRKMVNDFNENERIIWSCGGGMPPDVTTENIHAFKEAVDETA